MFNLKISSEQIKYVITILVTTIITAIFCTILIVKSPFRELNRYLKEPENFKFIDILNLLSSDIISLVLLMLVILLYYHAFSNIGLHRGFSYNLKYEINKIMKVIKSRSFKVNVSLIIIYFVLLFSINNNLGLISFLIYSFLLVNVTLIKYILYSFKNKQWSIYYLIYVVTLFISYQQSKYWMVIPAFQFFLIGIVYSILFIAKYFYPLLRAEYETAKTEKQLNINEYIIKTVSEKFLGIKKIEIINQLKIQNRKEKYILNQVTGFKNMLLKTRLSAETKEEVLVRYEDEVLDNHKISSIVGEVILKRNQNNLLIALIFLAFVLTLEITLFKFNYLYNDFLKVFKESIYIMIFIRLMLRSVEIGLAFYYDLKSTEFKKSNITSNKRITLAITSICEIILLSSCMYFLQAIESDKIKSYLDIIYIFIEQLKYAISVSIFNISLPNPEDNYHLSIIYNLSLNNIIHITQILLSIILISLSIANYSSKNTNDNSYFKVIKTSNNNLKIIEYIPSETDPVEKELIDADTSEELILKLQQKWKSSEIDFKTFNKLTSIIQFSLLKK